MYIIENHTNKKPLMVKDVQSRPVAQEHACFD